MKKKLLAILLTAAMVVCMMPAMAFAGEAPAEEAKEVAQEAQTPEEKSEEVAEAPEEQAAPAVVEEEKAEPTEEKAEAKDEKAEIKEEAQPEISGEWSGYEFTWEVEETAGPKGQSPDKDDTLYAYLISNENVANVVEAIGDSYESTGDVVTGAVKKNIKKIKLEDGIKDFTEEVNSVFQDGASFCMLIITDSQSGEVINNIIDVGYDKIPTSVPELEAIWGNMYIDVAAFTKFDVTVTVGQAAKKDTTFTYDNPYLIATEGITYEEIEDKIKMKDFPDLPSSFASVDDYYKFCKKCIGVVGDKLDLDLKKVSTEKYFNKLQSLANSFGFELNAELVDNTVVLEKGEKSVDDYLVYRLDGENFTTSEWVELVKSGKDIESIYTKAGYNNPLTYLAETFKIQLPLGMVFTETGNDGGYKTDKSVYVGTILVNDIVKQAVDIAKDVEKKFEKAKTQKEFNAIWADVYRDAADLLRGIGFNYAKFDNMNDLDATLAKINAKYDTLGERLAAYGKLFTEDELTSMTFTHLKGVNTGDSNSLGLWLVLGLMASAATAAYVLKRRED